MPDDQPSGLAGLGRALIAALPPAMLLLLLLLVVFLVYLDELGEQRLKLLQQLIERCLPRPP